MGMFDSLANGIASLFDKTPSAPAAPNVNIASDQQQAVSDNQKALPGAENLASQVNSFNSSQLHSLWSKAIPGYDAMVTAGGADIASELQGQLPADVLNQIQTSTNAAATAGGYGGSGMGRNLTSRDLGLTSLNLTQQGLSSAEKWMSTVGAQATPSLFSPTTMFLSPEQVVQNDWSNQTSQYNQTWLSNQLDAYKANHFNHAIASTAAGVADIAAAGFTGGMSSVGDMGGGANSVSSGGGWPTAADATGGGSSSSGGFDWNNALSSIFK